MDKNKGSYKRMRELALPNNSHLLEEKVGEKLEWLCPKNGKECQLNNKKLMKTLGLPTDMFEGFWPTRQPQWDGLAISKGSKTLYLIEAKSHISEISSGNKLDDLNNTQKKQNFDRKRDSLLKSMKFMSVDDTEANREMWLHKYYQISNRIAFLLKMKEVCPTSKIENVKLLFINYVNDPDWQLRNMHATEEQWILKYDKIYHEMNIDEIQLNQIGAFVINIDASKMA